MREIFFRVSKERVRLYGPQGTLSVEFDHGEISFPSTSGTSESAGGATRGAAGNAGLEVSDHFSVFHSVRMHVFLCDVAIICVSRILLTSLFFAL